MSGFLGLIFMFAFIYLFFWLFFGNGIADIMTGPPPNELSDEDLQAMGQERWIKRRKRYKK